MKLKYILGRISFLASFYQSNCYALKSIVLKGIKNIEAEAVGADNHFFAGAAKGSLKRISKSFEDKKKVAQIQLSTEQDKTAKIGLQEQINNAEAIINDANDAIARLNKKD